MTEKNRLTIFIADKDFFISIFFIFIPVIFINFYIEYFKNNFLFIKIFSLFFYLMMFLVPLFFLRKFKGAEFFRLILGRRGFLFISAISLFVCLISIFLWCVYLKLEYKKFYMEFHINEKPIFPLISYLGSIAYFFAPLGETFIFFGFIHIWLRTKLGKSSSLFLVTMIWTLLHFWAYSSNVFFVSIHFFIFFIWGVSFEVTDSFLPSLMAHILFNLAVIYVH